ncbi:MAG: stage III sporulation protein AE [Clostridiales bacterium]|nr:stage III sporulation protein AE [Candidatus Cacconaster stercorequi]
MIIFLLLASLLPMRVEAAALPDAIQDALPQQAQELLDHLDTDEINHEALSNGGGYLWERTCECLGGIVKESTRSAVLILCVVLLCAIGEDCFQAAGNTGVRNTVSVVGVLAITLITAGNMTSLIGMGVETIDQLDVFSKALLPTLAAAVAAGGGIVSAGVKQVATVFFSDILITLIRNILLPLVYCYIAVSVVAALLPEQKPERIAKGICKGITWLLTGSLVLFTGYLTLAGAVTGSADALTVHMTRSVIGAAVPVVGNIISDATLSVLAGAEMLKNSIGVVGMLAVLAVCLLPFLHLGVQYLLYKLTAFLAGTIGSELLTKLIDALGGAFGLILGMAGTSALLLLISIASLVAISIS